MNYKTIQRIAALYQELKDLDAEIIAIDKMAAYVSSHPATINLSLTGMKTDPEKKQRVLNDEGDLIPQQPGESLCDFMASLYDTDKMIRSMYGIGTTLNKYPDKPKDFDLSYAISDSVCLGILGVLLSEKHGRRTLITDELKTLFNEKRV